MNTIQTIILSVIEGLTEFLPISSTAHMKFANPLLGVSQSPFEDMFEVVVQLAAILAVVVLYRKKFFDFKRIRFYTKLFIAIIPALVFGVLLKKHIDAALGNLTFIAWIMLLGGVLLLFVDKLFKNPTIDSEENITNQSAFIIGCGQVLSIVFPGLSRSAATIITGMSQKLTRSAAAEFSFFLAVPTMLAASAKSFYDACKENYLQSHGISEIQADTIKIHTHDIFSGDNLSALFTHQNTISLALGCVLSFVVALLAIQFFLSFLKKYGFKVWGIYRIVLGVFLLWMITSGHLK